MMQRSQTPHVQSLRDDSEMIGQPFYLSASEKRSIEEQIQKTCSDVSNEKKTYIYNMIVDMRENQNGPGAFDDDERDMLIKLNCRYLVEPGNTFAVLPFMVLGTGDVTYASYNALNRDWYFRIDQDERLRRLTILISMIDMPSPDTPYPSSMADMIRENTYINHPNHRNAKTRTDPNSIKYLIDVAMNQSQSIRLGLAIERFFAEYIAQHGGVEDIRPSNRKDEKEKDQLFRNEQTKTIYYSEWKANLNLDTEKSRSTVDKVNRIKDELRIAYSGYEIKWGLVGARYVHASEIPQVIATKYRSISDHVMGINDWLSMFGIPPLTASSYKQLLNDIVQRMFF